MRIGIGSAIVVCGLLSFVAWTADAADKIRVSEDWQRDIGNYCGASAACAATASPDTCASEDSKIAACIQRLQPLKPGRLLDQARQDCRPLSEQAWTLHGKAAAAVNPAEKQLVSVCSNGLVLLKATPPEHRWSGAESRQRDRIILRCETVLQDCAAESGSCTGLPLCIAAIENAHCTDAAHCAGWLGRRLNSFQRQEDLQTRNLLEQVTARAENAEQANRQLREQERQRSQVSGDASEERLEMHIERSMWRQLVDSYLSQQRELTAKREILDQALADEKRDADARNSDAVALALKEGMGGIASALRDKNADGSADGKSTEVIRQLDPDQPIESLFPDVELIEYGIVVLPHPLVPRHRRTFQSASDSIVSGMADAGFYLVGYYDPWVNYGDEGGKADKVTEAQKISQLSGDKKYGIRVFKKDGWRSSRDANMGKGPIISRKAQLRVLFQVGETQTYGVHAEAMQAALWRATAEVYGVRSKPLPNALHPLYQLMNAPLINSRGDILPAEPLPNNLSQICPSSPELVDHAMAIASSRSALPCAPDALVCRGTPLVSTSDVGYLAHLLKPYEDLRNRCVNRANIFVIGPTFSGSVESLRQSTQIFRSNLGKRKLISLQVRQKLQKIRQTIAEIEAKANKVQPYASATTVQAKKDSRPSAAVNAPQNTTTEAEQASLPSITAADLRRELHYQRQCADSIDRFIDSRFDDIVQNYTSSSDAAAICALPIIACSGDKTPECASLKSLNDELNSTLNRIRESPRLDASKASVNAVSASVTSASNSDVNKAGDTSFRQASLAISDKEKTKTALTLIKAGNRYARKIAVLYEPTSFGAGAFQSMSSAADEQVEVIGLSFPPNIADLRQRLRDNDKRNREQLALVSLSAPSAHLPIEEGVENGNEYPEVFGSRLTAASAEQRMRLMLDQLKGGDGNRPADAVIVAAADVRDRLYLFDRLSREIPGAMLIDLESDILLAHPDYLHATRGVAMLSSVPLSFISNDKRLGVGCEPDTNAASVVRQFDSDRNALLHLLARCTRQVFRTETKVETYWIGRDGPVLAQNSTNLSIGFGLSLRGMLSGLAYPLALLVCLITLGAIVALLYSVLAAPTVFSAETEFAAPWWGAKVISMNSLGWYSLLAAAIAILLLPFYLPLFNLGTCDLLYGLLQLILLLAVLSQIAWLSVTRRLKWWSGYADGLVRAGNAGKSLGDWSVLPGPKPRFLATPIEAGLPKRSGDGSGDPISYDDARVHLKSLEFGLRDSVPLRMALRFALRPGLKAIFALVCVSVLACYSALLSAWLYPVPDRGLILLGSLVLAVTAISMLASNAIAFERSAILSRLFCGTDSGLQISGHFIVTLVGPVVLLIATVIAADQPGVLDVTGGLVKWFTTIK